MGAERERSTGARRVLVSGRVQGVGFRYYAVLRARELGLAGWVRNLHDGRVEVHLEGDAAELERMVDWLREGPPSARVDEVEARMERPVGERGFHLRR